MRLLVRLLSRLAVLAGLAVLALVLYGRERAWERIGPADLGRVEFDALVRSPSPNDALAATPGLGLDADVALPLYEAPPEAVMAAIDAVIAREGAGGRARVVETGPLLRRVVTRSPLMRFPDTNTIEAVPLGGGGEGEPTEERTALRAYARATVGHADMGANARRLEAWLGALPLPRATTAPATTPSAAVPSAAQ